MNGISIELGHEKKIIDELQLVSFHLGNEEFAIDILNIQGINRMMDITRIPNAPDYIEGIINLRGKVIPIIDLRKKLGLLPFERTNETRFIVMETQNRIVGYIVDSVNEVLRIRRDILEPPPSFISGIDTEYITALGKMNDRLLIILDLEKIVDDNEKNEISSLNENNYN